MNLVIIYVVFVFFRLVFFFIWFNCCVFGLLGVFIIIYFFNIYCVCDKVKINLVFDFMEYIYFSEEFRMILERY